MVQLQLKEWLSKEDFPKNGLMKVRLLDEGEFGTSSFEGKEAETFEIGVELPTGEAKRWTMNKTSQRAVAEHYGPDTAKWVGQSVELFLSQANIAGKMVKVVYARGKA